MFRSYRLKALVAPLAAVVAVLTLACHQATAQVEAFKIVGAGVGPTGLPLPGQPAREHWNDGQATHLGQYFGDGTVSTDSAALDPATGTIVGEFGGGSPYVFTGADGDELACYYGRTNHGAKQPGTFELTILGVTADDNLIVAAHWVAEFVAQPDLSTGRFAGVTGSWIMDAWSEPFVLGSDDPVAYWWEGDGTLTFPNRK
jgi:hypothetical protein